MPHTKTGVSMVESDGARIAALEAIVSNLTTAVNRLDATITEKISAIKDEQILYLREADQRLADDQRRAWEAIRALENDRFKRQGSISAMLTAVSALVGLIGGAVGSFVTHYLR